MHDKDSLKNILHGGGKRKDESELPLADEAAEGQQDVGPCGWVWAKGVVALDVERGGAEPIVSLQYVYISVLSEFNPGKFWVLFVGLQSWKVTVEGRNLRPIFDRMNDHCLRKIRKADRDFGQEDGKPFVTGLKVEDVTPADKS